MGDDRVSESVRLHGRNRRARRVIAIVMLVLVVAWWLVVFMPRDPVPLEITRATTYLTEPLRADGTVDFAAALNALGSEGVTAKRNGVVLVLRAMGPSMFAEDPGFGAAVYRGVGMEPPGEAGSYFVDEVDYLASATGLPAAPEGYVVDESRESVAGLSRDAAAMADHFNGLWKRPWRAADEPHAAAWLEANREPLDLMAGLTGEHGWYWPMVVGPGERLMDARLPHLNAARSLGRGLAARAMMRIGEGEFEGAWRDILALHRLGVSMGGERMVVGRLVGAAITDLASEVTLELVDAEPPGEVVRRMHADLASLGEAPAFAEALVGERYMGVDAVQSIVRLPGGAGGSTWGSWLEGLDPDNYMEVFSVDLNSTLRRVNYWYDELESAMRVEGVADRLEVFEGVEERLELIQPRSQMDRKGRVRWHIEMLLWRFATPVEVSRDRYGSMLGDLAAMVMMPSLDRALQYDLHARAQRRLADAAVALCLYRAGHGAYPESLSDLGQVVGGRVPLDPFTGEVMGYRRDGDGYVLWSVGFDLVDGGGLVPLDSSVMGIDDAYDIVHRVGDDE